MAEHTLGVGLKFRDGEEARRWLLDHLERLEESVADAADIHQTSATLTGDALTQLESDPLAFRKSAVIHFRDLLSEVTDRAASRAEREGLNVKALERLVLSTLGTRPSHTREILEGLAAGFRERIDRLSVEGNAAHEGGQGELDDALGGLDRALEQAVRRWESAPLGIWNRYRRRRKLKRQGLDHVADLPELALGLASAAREQRPSFEQAWGHVVRAGIHLGLARSYAATLDWLVTVLHGVDDLARQAGELAREAAQRRRRLKGDWTGARVPDRHNLLSLELLDEVIDQLELNAAAFLDRSEVKADQLGAAGRQVLESDLRRWIEARLGALPDAGLRDVLAGFRPDADVSGPLVELLAAGQPLMRFNDDLHRLWPEGHPAQYYVIAGATDDSLHDALADACVAVGLPSPLSEVDAAEAEATGHHLELRVLQLVGGLAWLSEAERLLPMMVTHATVMSEADAQLETREGLRAALRDTLESEAIGDVLPDKLRRSLRELDVLRTQALEAPRGSVLPAPSASGAGGNGSRGPKERPSEDSPDEPSTHEMASAPGRSAERLTATAKGAGEGPIPSADIPN